MDEHPDDPTDGPSCGGREEQDGKGREGERRNKMKRRWKNKGQEYEKEEQDEVVEEEKMEEQRPRRRNKMKSRRIQNKKRKQASKKKSTPPPNSPDPCRDPCVRLAGWPWRRYMSSVEFKVTETPQLNILLLFFFF